ncbi:MAG: hypothetical protein U0X73_04245 [Thermoanaerobaculia bacterium]
MKKVRALRLASAALLLAETAIAQFGMIAEPSEAAALKAELERRIEASPTDPETIGSERTWVLQLLTKIQRTESAIAEAETVAPDQRYSDMRAALSSLIALTCNQPDTQETSRTLTQARRVFQSFRANSPFDGPESSAEANIRSSLVDSRFEPIIKGTRLTQAACVDIQDALRSLDLVSQVAAAEKEHAELQRKSLASSQTVRETLKQTRTRAEEYLKNLDKTSKTVRARHSFEENLPWYVALLGGLGLLSMLVVRLFPDSVMAEWVASGQVVQFVTVTIVLTTILALARIHG